MKTIVHVAAAALIDRNGAVLLAKRHADSHQGGLWEFPGGKLEPNEPVIAGLKRELHEELGIEIIGHRPLIRVCHDYADRSVLLDVHVVTGWQGEPHGREGQPLVWVRPHALAEYPMPAADVPIVTALQLPPTYLITPPQIDDRGAFMRQLNVALSEGVRLVQLRLFDLSKDALLQVGRDACAMCHEHEARVLLNGTPDIMVAIGADGLHLNSRQLHQWNGQQTQIEGLLAASCHSPADLQQAEAIDADFALLSPVLPTRSHPDAEPLGWSKFADWVDSARLPVYALGGMHTGVLATAWAHGAQGIAGIRGLWNEGPSDNGASG